MISTALAVTPNCPAAGAKTAALALVADQLVQARALRRYSRWLADVTGR